ncbi:xanthine dehydrogenase accessory protein XdhC [Pulveribacter suum]|uniref:Xanthine dehydrogenase accessory protein XdhC n=1 Tax=Pulveribacter suum TaxID=2116657 RepID=A0A2P1NMT1_9BURK|nr:xanthine dehydrogenase accessory protein XdhC [Pulveribacter suum]AVP58359.1 xanthine dehydrogenase accessory protein XdhC [Pulveribacter suum]
MTTTALQQLLHGLEAGPACLVTVQSTQGSVPRERGAWMALPADPAQPLIGTIGGGHLEFAALQQARQLLDEHLAGRTPRPHALRQALGPSLGQCCGGVVHLRLECITALDAAPLGQRLAPTLQPVALFGGGHVGHALVRTLAPLPFALHWIDSRDGVFGPQAAPCALCEHSDPVHAAVPMLVPQSFVLIMSFSHAEDLDIVAACLARQRQQGDLPFIGLIGSRTKWATFRHRLEARGFTPQELAHVTCPIGVSGITGKEPEVIAVAVAAQLLQALAARRAHCG